MSNATAIKTLPWGEEIYMEISLNKRSMNRFYARHGKNPEGKEYVEFAKFGPKPNTENENYLQKLRIYSPRQWAQLKHYVENDLGKSIGWDTTKAQKDFEASLKDDEPQAS